jgi:3-isopropylmalate/(R)-2-methylmalate dehydratase large subunit
VPSRPFVTWGTNPGQGVALSEVVPDPAALPAGNERDAAERALEYMGLTAGTPLRDVTVDTVFLGSCTNGRMEDLRAAADVVRGRKVADGIRAMVVPGSMLVKLQAEQEGLDRVFTDAGFGLAQRRLLDVPRHEPRHAGAGGAQRLDVQPQLRGTPGRGGRTHLVSPEVAAATAVAGRLAAPADLPALMSSEA